MKSATAKAGRTTSAVAAQPFPMHAFVRFLAAYALGVGVFYLLQSPVPDSILGGKVVFSGGLDAAHIIAPLLAMGLLCHAARAELSGSRASWPAPIEIGLAFAGVVATMFLSYAITHVYAHDIVRAFVAAWGQVPFVLEVGLQAIGITIYVVHLLPMAVAPFLFIPWTTLRAIRRPLLVVVVVVVGYLYASVAEYVFHEFTAPVTLSLAARIVSLFPGNVRSLPTHWTLGYQSFFVTYGPACSSFSAIALILAAFFYLRSAVPVRPRVLSPRVIVAVALPFLVFVPINAVRVAAIVVIGAAWPTIATDLFHPLSGSVLFLAIFAPYLWIVVPWTLGSGHAKGHQE